jgi:hypothetical protein
VGSDVPRAAEPGKTGKCGEPASIADPAAIGEETKVWETMARERANADEMPGVLFCLLGSEAAAVRPSATDDGNPRDGLSRSPDTPKFRESPATSVVKTASVTIKKCDWRGTADPGATADRHSRDRHC